MLVGGFSQKCGNEVVKSNNVITTWCNLTQNFIKSRDNSVEMPREKGSQLQPKPLATKMKCGCEERTYTQIPDPDLST